MYRNRSNANLSISIMLIFPVFELKQYSNPEKKSPPPPPLKRTSHKKTATAAPPTKISRRDATQCSPRTRGRGPMKSILSLNQVDIVNKFNKDTVLLV